jgi:hypothetical protein
MACAYLWGKHVADPLDDAGVGHWRTDAQRLNDDNYIQTEPAGSPPSVFPFLAQ